LRCPPWGDTPYTSGNAETRLTIVSCATGVTDDGVCVLLMMINEMKSYYLGDQRIAQRQGGVLTYLHGDHLGSASLATNASGAKITNSDTRYYPYGVTRPGLAGTGLPTDRRFTGQREEASLGCYDYGARQYDPALGRFLQADTLVPNPGNPQSLNRYAYTLDNPLRYTDPSGHYTNDEIQKYLQETYGADWQSYWEAWQADPYWMWILDHA